ncbi:MAG TPA: prepilin-type N-terminal cleavage/methylation domain-containing protein [Smithellaceae bacterium]|jgi:prepilin-type N-terminal cleavage/methylation domain-containing protein|nr:prepilin-type N-terminal cleavage/methylation domain-containing protein [Smithellaceae bacterium]HQF84171.1 prepilin-type N-terminal cleavage/methylation domain-containing protein [Smithellaceae bacterium]HQG79959.1 prepilin-type N-terminal cleavage/methylation domain-containing protein [Smithellaceae bacterium]
MPSICSFRRSPSRGFTLLEIMIAVFILGVVLTTIYAAYTSTLGVIRNIEDESVIYKMARGTLDRMARDLTALGRFDGKFFLRSERKGIGVDEFGYLTFWSSSHLVFEPGELDGAPAMITYFVKRDKEGRFSLWRSDVLSSRPATESATDRGVVICQNIKGFAFRFFDEAGGQFDHWDTRSAPPQKDKPPTMMEIELVMANDRDPEMPYKFTTKIFFPVRK